MKPTTEINTTIDYRKIGAHLKEARKANSLSQAQVAAFLHISVCAYGNLERGSQRINLTRLMQLCELLGVAPGSILADCTPRLVSLKGEDSQEEFSLPTDLLKALSACSTAERKFLVDFLRRFTKGYYIKQLKMDCQPTEFTALSRHRAVFSWAGKGGIPICGA